MFTPRSAALVSLVIGAALFRILPHPWNVTPIVAMALFGGAKFEKRGLAVGAVLAAMFISDLFLEFSSVTPAIYLTLVAIVFLGARMLKEQSVVQIGYTSILSSILFFIASNFATWALDTLYPHTLSGLAACFVAAIPFFQNALLGDLFFSGVIFGSFALLERKVEAVRIAEI